MVINVKPYKRRVFYYETDQMSIVHHSNYIRWMEEARLDYMRQAGVNYREMEEEGIIMPVVSVDCRYITPTHYDDTIDISVSLTAFNGVRASFCYEIKSEDGTVVASGHSEHCFLDATTRRPISLKRRLPSFYEQCYQLLEE